MFHIRVERLLKKDINSVFEAITDHQNYKRFSGISGSSLLEHGTEEQNGVDALRRIESGPLYLLERITRFERPTCMHYQIEVSKPIAMRHDKGQISLQAEGEHTRVVWESIGHMQVPLLGNLVLDKMVQKSAAKTFNSILKTIERD